MYDQLPSNLKTRKQFCNWKLEDRNGRMTKVPYRTNGKRANPADPQSFTDFDAVCAVRDKFDGIGIFGDLFAIDIDHCVVSGVVSEMARDIIDTMEFTPHDPEDRLTKKSPVNYDPFARCDRFQSFVKEITGGDTEKARFLQKVLGYGMSGDTRYECLFILYGATTRNGKGTLCESVLKVLGTYGCTARPETLSVKTNANSHNPSEDIARLAGVRFANISEPGKGMVLNAAQVKSMTGNDTLNARFLHENSFDFIPQFKLYINTNYLPVINDMTLFNSGRVVTIPFERHFEEAEQDKGLKAEFRKPENQSAILNWLVEGYQLLMQEGMKLPESVITATDEYRKDSDKVWQFVQERLDEAPSMEVRTSEVYDSYRSWCSENGCHPENSRNFNQALRGFATVVRRRPRRGGGATTLLLGYRIRASEFLSA